MTSRNGKSMEPWRFYGRDERFKTTMLLSPALSKDTVERSVEELIDSSIKAAGSTGLENLFTTLSDGMDLDDLLGIDGKGKRFDSIVPSENAPAIFLIDTETGKILEPRGGKRR